MIKKVKNPGRGYSGHEKIKMYQYDSNGKYMRSYESQSEVRKIYFKHIKGKRPLLHRGNKYESLPDGTFISNKRIGRNEILKLERIKNCPLCRKQIKERPFSAYNLLGNKIGTFYSQGIASKLLGISPKFINHSLNKGKGILKSNKIIFKFD